MSPYHLPGKIGNIKTPSGVLIPLLSLTKEVLLYYIMKRKKCQRKSGPMLDNIRPPLLIFIIYPLKNLECLPSVIGNTIYHALPTSGRHNNTPSKCVLSSPELSHPCHHRCYALSSTGSLIYGQVGQISISNASSST